MRVLDDPHAFVDLVLRGDDVPDAVDSLRAHYGLSEVQALAALDMQLRRLGSVSRSRIRFEADAARAECEGLTGT